MTTYALDNAHHASASRLGCLAALYDTQTAAALDYCVPGRHVAALDLGSGLGSTAVLLAERLGSGSRVVAVDSDLRWCIYRDDPRVRWREGDVRDPAATAGQWDVVHARLLLSHVPERDELVRRLAAQLAPGGLLVVSELDPTAPYCPAAASDTDQLLNRIGAGFDAVLRAAGQDNGYGQRFGQVAQAAGLQLLDCWGYTARSTHHGHPAAQLMRANINQTRAQLREATGLADADLDTAAEALADGHPFNMPTLFTTVARKETPA